MAAAIGVASHTAVAVNAVAVYVNMAVAAAILACGWAIASHTPQQRDHCP